MSSIINKSSVRFTPKVRQRRSVGGTPNESRRASVVPSVDPILELGNSPELKRYDDEDGQEEDDDENDKQSDAEAPTTTTNNLQSSRRSSIADISRPHETKQRRLSTLSNTSRPGDLLKRASISDSVERPHVIGIPLVTPTATSRRRSSVRKTSLSSRRSSLKQTTGTTPTAAVVTPITPASTQEATSLKTLSKAEGKLPEDDEAGEGEKQQIEGRTAVEGAEKMFVPPSPEPTQEQVGGDNEADEGEAKTENLPKVLTSYGDLKPRKFGEGLPLPSETHAHTIDQDTFPMKDLCNASLPIGKPSSNFELVRKARAARMQQRKERRELRQQARQQKRSLESFSDEIDQQQKKVKPESLLLEDTKGSSSNANPATIQLKVTEGVLTVDEESMVLDRHAGFDKKGMVIHTENPFENIVNSATYGKQRYTDKWEENEVKLFYQGLSQWGTDFGLISQMFPHRTRRQIKAKFISEEKKRPRAIELALMRKLNFTFDLDQYSEHANRNFNGMDEFNNKLLKLKEEHEMNLKELSIAKEKAKEEDAERQKKKEFEVKTGQRTLTRQERLTELRKHETVLGSIDDIKKQRELEANMATENVAS